jgi:hypothetical protein
MADDITKFYKEFENKENLEKLGSKIVEDAIKNIAEEKINLKPENANTTLKLNKGELVPIELRDLIETDINGKSKEGWEDSWIDLGPWVRSWSESTKSDTDDDRMKPILDFNDRIFQPEEINILKELNIYSDLQERLK